MKRLPALPVMYVFWILLATSVVTVADTPMDLVTAGTGIYPTLNTMTLLPGPACPYPDGGANHNDVANRDYGGAGSLSVASETARANTDGYNHQPKGLFRSVLRFDSSALPVDDLATLTLNLNIRNGNTSAFSLYNFRGTAGYFTVSLIYDGWSTGKGTPNGGTATIADPSITDAYDTDPLTHNNLDAMLAETPPVELGTFYYDASVPYSAGAAWFFFDLTTALAVDEFSDALDSGGTFSLLLSPAWIDVDNDGTNDNQVAFNFSTRTQVGSDGAITTRPDGPVLSFTVPEPASLVLMTVGLAMFRRRTKCEV